jgi:hypothetical protein
MSLSSPPHDMTTPATRFGSLIFCAQCGNLLDLPGDEDDIVCEGCGKVEDATGRFSSHRCSCPGLTMHCASSVRESYDHHEVQPVRVPIRAEAEEDEFGAAEGSREEEGLRESGR